MCGHCRLIVAGAFVIGSLTGFLASSALLDAKYRKHYEEREKDIAEAGRRTVKGLKEKLAKYEEGETYICKSPNDLAEKPFITEFEPVEETLETESEKIPEGKTEEATPEGAPVSFCTKDTFETYQALKTYPERHWTFIREGAQWLDEDGKLMPEKTVKAIFGEEGMSYIYRVGSHGEDHYFCTIGGVLIHISVKNWLLPPEMPEVDVSSDEGFEDVVGE